MLKTYLVPICQLSSAKTTTSPILLFNNDQRLLLVKWYFLAPVNKLEKLNNEHGLKFGRYHCADVTKTGNKELGTGNWEQGTM